MVGLVGIEPNDLTVMSGWLLTNELQALKKGMSKTGHTLALDFDIDQLGN